METGMNLGHNTNRKFYEIAYRKFINILFSKAMECGIKVKEINESYTSGCDALNNEEVSPENYDKERRVCRGLFKSEYKGIEINADTNGQINIGKKYIKKMIYEKTPGWSNKEYEKYETTIRKNIEKIQHPIKIKTYEFNEINTKIIKPYIDGKYAKIYD